MVENLLDNTAALVVGFLAFIVGLPATIIAILNYRQGNRNQTDSLPSTLEETKQNKLFHILDENYNDQELRTLCFELSVDYDDLPFSGQSNKARELVSLLARNGRLSELENKVKLDRPHLLEDEHPEI